MSGRPSSIASVAALIGVSLLACKQPGHGHFLFSGVFAHHVTPSSRSVADSPGIKPRQCRQAARNEFERILRSAGKCL